jgi:hypothetical protein
MVNTMEMLMEGGEWPDLPYDRWQPTRDTLHMYLQVIGKVRLALTPREPQWGNVPLYLTARGLTTSPIWGGRAAFSIDVDFIDHQVVVANSEGRVERVALTARPVADFYADLRESLQRLGVGVDISTTPSEVPDPIPFPLDTLHASYEPEWAQRFWRLLSRIDLILKEHRAAFRGRSSQVHFFWGTFDLAYTRFSGRPAEPPPGADLIARVSADAEQVCAGFWPGNSQLPEPAFFAYAYPSPAGVEKASVLPAGAGWNAQIGEFILTYDEARRSGDVRAAILDFLRSTYQAEATRLGWEPDLVTRSVTNR